MCVVVFEAADRLALLAAVLNTRFVVVGVNLPSKLLRVALLHAFAGKQHSTTLQLVSCLCEAAGVAACYGSACSWAYQISEEEQHDGLPVSVCHCLSGRIGLTRKVLCSMCWTFYFVK